MCFDRQDWLGCAHGCMLALILVGDEHQSHLAVSDDGVIHELLHLHVGADLCTCNTLDELRTIVVELESKVIQIVSGVS